VSKTSVQHVTLTRAQMRVLKDLRAAGSTPTDNLRRSTIEALTECGLASESTTGWLHIGNNGRAAQLLTGNVVMWHERVGKVEKSRGR
jgi:hypothetical protein